MEEKKTCGEKYCVKYQIINWLAVLGHLAASVIFTVLYYERDPLQIPYTETYLSWNKTGNLSNCPKGSRPLETSSEGFYCIQPTTGPLNCDDAKPPKCDGLDLGWLIISFHLLSFIFQALAGFTDCCKDGCCGYKYSTMIEVNGKNPLRFIDYSISASIMLMCIAFLNGVTDINLIENNL